MPAKTPKERRKSFLERCKEKGYRQVSFLVPESEIQKIKNIVQEIKDDYILRNGNGGKSINENDG
jgi:hypothetical protein